MNFVYKGEPVFSLSLPLQFEYLPTYIAKAGAITGNLFASHNNIISRLTTML